MRADGAAKPGMSALPRHLPILAAKRARGGYERAYQERERTAATRLCDERGLLNPDAVGWSRFPRVTANLSGHRLRKKRWNFWSWIGRRFVFSVTVADLDYASFCSFFFIDFETGERVAGMDPRRGGYIAMPEEVERTLRWRSAKTDYALVNEGGDLAVAFRGRGGPGEEVAAAFTVRKPPDHESLNLVVPWTRRRFQLNSKHNTLRCEGEVVIAGRRYEMRPDDCHAVQDFGRGVWPYRSCWNWAVCTGEQGGELVGLNLGDRWTTGTGVNENGICHAGRLHKVMEDLEWRYDPADWMRPWRIRSVVSDAIDLTLTPFFAHTTGLNLGLLATGGTCAFGLWSGAVRFEGREVAIRDQVGWAEEFAHRW